jgi:hypothetical protein
LSMGKEYDSGALNRPEAQQKHLVRVFYQYPSYSVSMGIRRTAIRELAHRTYMFQTFRSKIKNIEEDRGGQIYQQWRRHRAEASDIRDQLPDLSAGLNQYVRNLKELVRIGCSHSVRVILMTQPSMYRPDLPEEYRKLLWLGGVGEFQNEPGHVYYSVRALAEAYTLYNQALLQFCEQQSLECIDLAPRLPKDTRAFYDDAHFNEAGSEIVAKVVFDYLRTRSPFNGVTK